MSKLIRTICTLQQGMDITTDSHKGYLKCKDEDWSIRACTKDNSGIELELAEINMHFPDGSRWGGTIQDLMAIRSYMKNALADLKAQQSFARAAAKCSPNTQG